LEKAYCQLKAKVKDKAQRERAERAEEKRLNLKYEKARSAHLAEGLDEKETLGSRILEKTRLLKYDRLMQKSLRCLNYYSTENGVIYRRHIANTTEMIPHMFHLYDNSEVDEYFQLDSVGRLFYNQLYNPRHFSDGYLYHEWISNPQKYGVKLASPADFKNLSINSVRCFYEALEKGEHYKILADDMKKLSKEFEEE
jgi:hypothetical protein